MPSCFGTATNEDITTLNYILNLCINVIIYSLA